MNNYLNWWDYTGEGNNNLDKQMTHNIRQRMFFKSINHQNHNKLIPYWGR